MPRHDLEAKGNDVGLHLSPQQQKNIVCIVLLLAEQPIHLTSKAFLSPNSNSSLSAWSVPGPMAKVPGPQKLNASVFRVFNKLPICIPAAPEYRMNPEKDTKVVMHTKTFEKIFQYDAGTRAVE